jgi:hypothetical protein
MLHFSEINYLAVLAATVATMIIGFLWYSPVLFGQAWMKQVGLKKEDMSSGGAMTYVLTAVTALVGSFILALLLTLVNDKTISCGLIIGLLVGLSISAKIGMNFLFEGRKLGLYLITVGYHLLSYLVAGLIIGAM